MCVQLLGQVRLLDVVVHTHLIAPHHVRRILHTGGKHDGLQAIPLPDLGHHLVAIHDGHFHVGHDDIWPERLPQFQSFRTVGGFGHLISADHNLQAVTNHIAQRGIVFYQ